MTSPHVPPQAITAAADVMPGLTREHAIQVATEALEAAAPHLAAYDPRDFSLTASDLRAVADRLYDCADSRLDPMDDVSARFGPIRSHLRGLADALDEEAQPCTALATAKSAGVAHGDSEPRYVNGATVAEDVREDRWRDATT